jgi:hypothetical protein
MTYSNVFAIPPVGVSPLWIARPSAELWWIWYCSIGWNMLKREWTTLVSGGCRFNENTLAASPLKVQNIISVGRLITPSAMCTLKVVWTLFWSRLRLRQLRLFHRLYLNLFVTLVCIALLHDNRRRRSHGIFPVASPFIIGVLTCHRFSATRSQG